MNFSSDSDEEILMEKVYTNNETEDSEIFYNNIQNIPYRKFIFHHESFLYAVYKDDRILKKLRKKPIIFKISKFLTYIGKFQIEFRKKEKIINN
jgi:hypothetical protein